MDRTDNLKVIGHRGTWYVIAETDYRGAQVYLLESETYGEDAACIIVDENLIVMLDEVYNGFDDLWEYENPRYRSVGVELPDFPDQAYIRARDEKFWSISDEHAISQYIHHYKDSWLRPDEYKLVKVLPRF